MFFRSITIYNIYDIRYASMQATIKVDLSPIVHHVEVRLIQQAGLCFLRLIIVVQQLAS